MTIDALRAIQDEEFPEVRRRSTPRTARPQPPVPPTDPAPSDDAGSGPDKLPVEQLLAWADQHPDPGVRDQGARARNAIASLRVRHTVDIELAAITTEAGHLEQRLAELRAREAELAPQKANKKPARFAAGEVRAWAKSSGVDCPQRGRVPAAVVDAWRQATGRGA